MKAQVLVKAKAKAKVLVLEKVVKEKALQPLGKVERVALVAVAKAKVKENPLVAVKAQVLEKVKDRVVAKAKAQARAVDRAKALEAAKAVKVQAKAKEAVVERVKAREKVQAKAKAKEVVKVENQVLERAKAKANPLAKAEKLVEKEGNPLKVKHPKIILLTLWKILLASCHKLKNKKNKSRLVRLPKSKHKKISISNPNPVPKNVAIFLIYQSRKPEMVIMMRLWML